MISEALIHASGQLQGLILILIGNELHWPENSRIAANQLCSEGLVDPRDYTPFYYLLMAGSLAIATSFIFFVNPTMRRSEVERSGEQERRATDAISHG